MFSVVCWLGPVLKETGIFCCLFIRACIEGDSCFLLFVD